MKIMKLPFLVSLMLWVGHFLVSNSHGKEMTLDSFLHLVGQESLQLQSLQEKQEGLEFTLSQTHLIYSPYSFGSFGYSDDERQKLNTQFVGVETIGKFYEFGVGKRFNSGAELKLGYTNQFADIRGTVLQDVTAYEPALKLSLAIPLWRNFGGGEWSYQAKTTEFRWRSQIYAAKQTEKNLLTYSENLYWQYATLLAIKEIQIQGLKRSKEIENWASNRVKNSLGDQSDLYQSQAVVVGKELNLNETEDKIQSLKKAIETLLNREEKVSDAHQWEMPKEIPLPQAQMITNAGGSETPMTTSEVQAIYYQSESEQNSYQETKEQNRFKLDLVADYAWTSRERGFNDSWNELKTGDFPWWTLAIKYEQSLDFGSIQNVEAGQYKLINASKKDYQNALQKAQKDWLLMVNQWSLLEKKQKLCAKLELIQQNKLDFERKRLRTGRTTTFQVLQFEFDYLQSQLQHLQTKLELWNLKSQAQNYFPLKS
ncbi:MAG: hypothetical protein QE271_13060 [Bacteriovoracaceae bacterium]|nr:hypothetical protein [Bacteriovoracaceae bacterium]